MSPNSESEIDMSEYETEAGNLKPIYWEYKMTIELFLNTSAVCVFCALDLSQQTYTLVMRLDHISRSIAGWQFMLHVGDFSSSEAFFIVIFFCLFLKTLLLLLSQLQIQIDIWRNVTYFAHLLHDYIRYRTQTNVTSLIRGVSFATSYMV